jgi:putative thiamine transport system permease protein
LLVPQIAFLLGIQVLLITLRLDETFFALVAAHLVFVLPYVFLSLADPWRSYDARYRQVALSLGASPWRALIAVRLPMLLRACLAAGAIGVAVSIGQYLATQLVAGARWPSITTEAVSASSGGNRRTLALYAVLQTLVPLTGFMVATLVPSLVFRNRRGMGSA